MCIGNGSVALNPHAGTSSRLRSCYEALSVLAMTAPLLTLLENKGLYQSFSTVEMPHLSCLAKMETDGFGEFGVYILLSDNPSFSRYELQISSMCLSTHL